MRQVNYVQVDNLILVPKKYLIKHAFVTILFLWSYFYRGLSLFRYNHVLFN